MQTGVVEEYSDKYSSTIYYSGKRGVQTVYTVKDYDQIVAIVLI